MLAETYFIPYTLNPFDSMYKFERDNSLDKVGDKICGDYQNSNMIHINWYEYLEKHLKFPFDAKVEGPVKINRKQSTATVQKKMKIVSLAPLDRTPAPFIVLVVWVNEDEGRYVYTQDIIKIIKNEYVEKILLN